MKYLFTSFFLVTAFFSTVDNSPAATDVIGIVKASSGEVLLTRAHTTHSVSPLMKLSEGDLISTGPTGNVGLIFNDDTAASLGPNSQFAIDAFRFQPAEQELSFVSRLIKGTFCFITGQIAKLAPDKVQFTTPEATLGVRGTKFLVEID